MQNHDEKITDIIRSVLPSTARREARATRRLIHRAARRKTKSALRTGESEVFIDVRGAVSDMVWDRRAADKVGPLVRWALHQVRHDLRLAGASLGDRLDHFRQLLPDTTIGRHALSHIAWPLERLDRASHGPAPAYRATQEDAALVRALLEVGYHRELNARLKIQQLPVLAGVHDVERFVATASTVTRWIVRGLAGDVGIRK